MTIEIVATALAAFVILMPAADLALLALASLRPARKTPPLRRPGPALSVLIAAHNEEAVIGHALARIASVDRTVRAHVVADNCTDRTAAIAAEAGACVHVRTDRLRPGKAAALNRLIAEVLEEDHRAHAFAFLDADARPETGYFDGLREPIARGARAAQAKNLVVGTTAPLTRLRELAFHLKCDLRPRAYDALGMSVGLHGNGMCLTRDVLRRYLWDEGSVVEDGELHLRLVRDGVRVALARNATVRSPMPTTFGEGAGQAVRWERGKVDLLADAFRLMRTGLRSRRLDAIVAAYDVLIPPLSFLIAASGVLTVTALVMGSTPLLAVGVLSLAGCAMYVARGLALARLDLRSLAGLLTWSAPYLVWKVALFAGTVLGAGRGQWSQARTQARE